MKTKRHTIAPENTTNRPEYHHGDLRPVLIRTATSFIEEHGIDALSLRKLAAEVGVSRTAPYHHFNNKNDLLCTIAEQGFSDWIKAIKDKPFDPSIPIKKQLKLHILDYVNRAKANPEIYDLMFGRKIWRDMNNLQSLKDVAYPCFKMQLEITQHWQHLGLLDQSAMSLRLSQVIWGTMHGISKLFIDGIYTSASQIEEICDCAAEQFSRLNL